ncbi:NUDIX domain-containing protein [Candidatus Woesebacteria bacterium]|nr:NUDIX domain-containing protein [Candidatus Woesebacteria bacterium]
MKQTTIEEISAGGVVYRVKREFTNSNLQFTKEYEFLIGKHSGYHKWVLPKGHIEVGETEQETAVREVEEELGVKTIIVNETPIKVIEYDFMADLDNSGETTRTVKNYQEQGGSKTKIHKKVIFYLMELESDVDKPGWEMSESKWVSFEEGIEILAFESEREVFGEAGKALKCL